MNNFFTRHPVGAAPQRRLHERDPETRAAQSGSLRGSPLSKLASRQAAGMTLLFFSVLALAGCTSREQADEKLAKGCAAGAELFLPEGTSIKEIRKKNFSDSAEFGSGFRQVVLTVLESDGWYEEEQEYKCVFEDSIGLFGMGHSAAIHQLKVHDAVYGKEGDQILGSYDDHLKLTKTVDDAMNSQ